MPSRPLRPSGAPQRPPRSVWTHETLDRFYFSDQAIALDALASKRSERSFYFLNEYFPMQSGPPVLSSSCPLCHRAHRTHRAHRALLGSSGLMGPRGLLWARRPKEKKRKKKTKEKRKKRKKKRIKETNNQPRRKRKRKKRKKKRPIAANSC